MINRLFKVAIIGAGIGKEHLNAFNTQLDRFSVKYICDLDVDKAKRLISNNNTKITEDYEEVLSDDEIDLIDICLPPDLHFEYVKKALEAGKHAICEKPLAGSLEEVDQLIKISQITKKNIYPVFQYRFGKGTKQLNLLIESGLAGKPFVASLETYWNRDSNYYDNEWRGTWKGERGGAILGHAIHIHDLLTMVFGEIFSVYAKLSTRVNNIEVEDCAALSIQMQNGSLVTSSITLGAANDTSRLKFSFENLTATSGNSPYKPAEDTWTFEARKPNEQKKIDEVIGNVENIQSGYAGLFSEIANNLEGKKSNEVNLYDGRKSIEFVTAVYKSFNEDKNIILPIEKESIYYKSWIPKKYNKN